MSVVKPFEENIIDDFNIDYLDVRVHLVVKK